MARLGRYTALISVLLMGVLWLGCRRSRPQLPTYHNGRQENVVDSSLLRVMEFNQHMAEAADRELSGWVYKGYAQQELGYWSKGLVDVDSPLREGEEVMLRAQYYTLSDSLLRDCYTSVRVGKDDLLPVVTEVLLWMEHGQHVSLVLPWYLAYGTTGDEQVGPYENIRVELTVE